MDPTMARTQIVMVSLLTVLVVAAAASGGGLAAETAAGTGPGDGGAPAVAPVTGPGDGGAPAAADATAGCSFPFSSVDATGTEVSVEEAPERVVTLNPSAAQTMWEIGARDRVVGVTKYATYLDGAAEKSNVSGGGFTTVVNEKVVALEPDLVLVPNATNNLNPGKVQQLRDAGLTVYVFGLAGSLEDISEKTLLTGKLAGACDGAEASAEQMESQVATVEDAVEGEQRPDVLFVLGPGGFTAGSGTFIHTAIETAGGANVAADENITGYKSISEEVVADRDPDWIVKPTGVSLPPSGVYNQSTAVQEGRVLEVDNNFVSQPAPQIVEPIVTMAKAFHPEAYAEANTTATPSPTPADTPATTDVSTEPSSPSETGSPGFGLVAALAALLAGGALLRRR
jgi:iron complex transport system substrate-binding protein